MSLFLKFEINSQCILRLLICLCLSKCINHCLRTGTIKVLNLVANFNVKQQSD